MDKKFLLIMVLTIVIMSYLFSGGKNMKHFYDFTVKDIMGNEIKLDTYKDKVILVVNVASKCGFTPQYEGLQKIYEKYQDQNFVILGFPANNFMGQEPGTNQEIKQFCTVNFGVTFPLFAKISVRGKDIHPLYAFLIGKETNPNFSGRITWNFNKFLLNRKGECINRFPSKIKPQDPELIETLEKALKEK